MQAEIHDVRKANMEKAPRAVVAAVILALALLGFFRYPGHVLLESDTLIYVPMLERVIDPSLYARDPMLAASHLNYTAYDEVTIGLHRLTGLDIQSTLLVEQFLARLAGLVGVYLIATSFSVPAGLALVVTAIFGLGAMANGPNVSTIEPEPIPRAIAFPLLLLGLGLLGRRQFLWAGVCGAVAFLIHPTSAYPIVVVLGAGTLFLIRNEPERGLRRNVLLAWIPLLAGVLLLAAMARLQQPTAIHGVGLLDQLDPLWADVEKQRTPYLWLSALGFKGLLYYAVLLFFAASALVRLPRPEVRALRFSVAALMTFAVLSVPAGYILYEHLGLAIMAGVQPLRLLIFITLTAILLPAMAGAIAASRGQFVESAVWFAISSFPAIGTSLLSLLSGVWRDALVQRKALLVILAALGFASAGWFASKSRGAAAALLAGSLTVVLAVAIPALTSQEPERVFLHSEAIRELSDWARASTARDAVFLFPDAGQEAYPAVFRALAFRSVYVDWEGGCQGLYFRSFAEEWWQRWSRVGAAPFDSARCSLYDATQIDYVVLRRPHQMPGSTPVHAGPTFVVYRTPCSG